MKIARERFLDDSTRWLLSMELWSRTAELHSAMDALAPDERQAIGDVMTEALDRIARIMEPVAIARGARPQAGRADVEHLGRDGSGLTSGA